MKTLYRSFMMMIVASMAMVCSMQASAAPTAVLQGTPSQIHAKGTFGYVEVDNDSRYSINVRAPSVADGAYAVYPGQSIAFYVGLRLGANVYVAYSFNPYNETVSYILNGETADVWDPMYMPNAKMGASKGSDNVKVNLTKHKTV